ncbi:MAG TPA: aminotransferase class I/II-fold pyridoxal phosphate-dependent enzyme [Candidatus Eremiobacteraceae bacterium]|jgi:cystathionine gamma-synthase
MRLETIAVHAGTEPDPGVGAVTPSINLSSIYERGADGGYPHGHSYARRSNPNRTALERTLASLEGGVEAAAFSSGSAATHAIFSALGSGAHVVAPANAYYGTRVILSDLLEPFGLRTTFVDIADVDAVRNALTPQTKMLWIETPGNPMLDVAPLAELAALAQAAGIACACDNTLATPVFQRPFECGVDLVMHATTKYLGGHSDVIGGAVVARQSSGFFERIRHIQHAAGAVPSPFECWLVQRGIRTLPHRLRVHTANALALAAFLRAHVQVKAVHYPGFSGVLSFQVHGGEPEAMRVAARARLFTRATSFGGPESLIEHRASVEGPDTKTPRNLLRLSVGLEHPDDLIEDLAQALG